MHVRVKWSSREDGFTNRKHKQRHFGVRVKWRL
jgi:hypothetical protein